MENDKHVFHAEIKKHWLYQSDKADDKTNGRLFVEGYASTGAVDRYDEIVVPNKEAWEKAIEAFMKNPILLNMHDYYDPAGLVTEMRIDEGVGFWIKAFISSTQERLKTQIMERIVRAFSIGFRTLKSNVEDGIRSITELELYEVSVATVPVNRETLFSISKALRDGTDLVISERKLEDEIDKLLTQKIAALGITPAAPPIKTKQVKGIETPEYANLQRVLAGLDEEKRARELHRFDELLENIPRKE